MYDSSVGDVDQTGDRIVSRWREVSADTKHQQREGFDEILRPLGNDTRLVLIRRGSFYSRLALYFICMTLSAVTSLREQWRSQQLRDAVEKLLTLLSRTTHTLCVERLIWLLTAYHRCLRYFSSVQG